jgi:plastocyanin
MHRLTIRLLAAGAVLALAACTPSTGSQSGDPTGSPGSTAGSTAATTAAAAGADSSTAIEVLDFKLDPAALSVTGTSLSLAVTNGGPTVHNVTVRDAAGNVLFGTKDLREGESETVSHAIAPGTYVLFCSLPGHESLGIRGTLTVTAP